MFQSRVEPPGSLTPRVRLWQFPHVSDPCRITWLSYEDGAALHQAAFSEPCQTTWISYTSRRYAPSSVFQSHDKSPCSHSLPPNPPTHGYPRDYSKRLTARQRQSNALRTHASRPRRVFRVKRGQPSCCPRAIRARANRAGEVSGPHGRVPTSEVFLRQAHLLTFAPLRSSDKH